MPIYLYQCDTCGVRFERRQHISEPPLETCPECDGTVRRIIQPVGVIFKGSGFYVTDNRQGSSPTLGPTKGSTDAEKKETPAGESTAKTETTAVSENKADSSA
jgi:putative FmdB family regulatory protein